MAIINETLRTRQFLAEMAADSYFPSHLVAKGADILVALCQQIEAQNPVDTAALFALTHAATEQFNQLEIELNDAGSEIETTAREWIGEEFAVIVEAYGFDVDIEEVIAPREW